MVDGNTDEDTMHMVSPLGHDRSGTVGKAR